jgi:hypothetical protein
MIKRIILCAGLMNILLSGCKTRPEILGQWVAESNCLKYEFLERDGVLYERFLDEYAEAKEVDGKYICDYGNYTYESIYSPSNDDIIRNNNRLIRFNVFIEKIGSTPKYGTRYNNYNVRWAFDEISIKKENQTLFLHASKNGAQQQSITLSENCTFDFNGEQYWIDFLTEDCSTLLICSIGGCFHYQ